MELEVDSDVQSRTTPNYCKNNQKRDDLCSLPPNYTISKPDQRLPFPNGEVYPLLENGLTSPAKLRSYVSESHKSTKPLKPMESSV
ncbi:unnamed protein product [Brassica oleracea var. botrytis]